ncbi:hypothetical protein MSIMFI_02861 [Mycobacterium simulans]|uniref:ATP-dependent nuclease n=1 Tax=Mycobacterium simulans TaxID=627089 RepID=UPI00174E2EE3|nr:AAA family ATPase [Mycobacterium simulans]SON61356.1 hypothetical protein MSIMFI_02861 [Mycobacterium simulans]
MSTEPLSDAEVGLAENFGFAILGVRVGGGELLKLPGPGSVVAVVGANNVGKSTFLRQIQEILSSGNLAKEMFPSVVTELAGPWVGSEGDFTAWLLAHARIDERAGIKYVTRNSNDPQIPLQNTSAIRKLPTPGGLTHWFVSNLMYPSDRQMVCGMSNRSDPSGSPPQTAMQVLFADILKREKIKSLAARMFDVELHFDTVSASIGFRLGRPDVAPPNVDEIDAEYATAVGKLPLLTSQGDGIKSALGLLIPLIVNENPLSIVDEPEAFLHPPQAEILGSEIAAVARANNSQVILATHDKNILQGLARSETPLSIIHLRRSGDSTTAIRLGADDIEYLWKNVTLRYGNALDSLFHRAVIIAEADRDAHFYRAAIDFVQDEKNPKPPAHNLMFLSSYGKQNMASIVERLRKLGVRTVTTPDLDILNDETVLRRLVIAHGGDWDTIKQLYKQATNEFLGPAKSPTIDEARAKIEDVLSKNVGNVLDKPLAKALATAVSLPTTSWSRLKEAGSRAFHADREAAAKLLDALDAVGIIAVKVGELENFVTNANAPKGPEFLPVAFAAGAHRTDEAQAHANRLLTAAGI